MLYDSAACASECANREMPESFASSGAAMKREYEYLIVWHGRSDHPHIGMSAPVGESIRGTDSV